VILSISVNAKIVTFDTPSKFAPKHVGPCRTLELYAHGNAARSVELPDTVTFKARRVHDVLAETCGRTAFGPVKQNKPLPQSVDDSGSYYAVTGKSVRNP
jgi:hypothetical protein